MTDGILLSKSKLGKFILSLSEKDFKRVKQNFDSALEKRRAFDLEQEKERQKKLDFLKRVEQMAAEEGLDVADLLDEPTRSSKTGKKGVVPKKYRITEENGEVIEWAGRGRPPKAFAVALERGKTLDDFLIDGE